MSVRRLALALAVALSASACGPDGTADRAVVGSEPATSSTTAVTPTAAPATDASSTSTTTEVTTARDPDPAPGRPEVSLRPVDLGALAPVAALTDILTDPTGAELWIVEQRGLIRRATGDGDPVILDITDRTAADGERGLLGAVLVDDGERLVVNYTSTLSDTGGDTIIEMFDLTPAGTADMASGIRLLTIGQPYANHNGGDLELLGDGTILVASGDGGSGGDPDRVAHRLDNRLGKILRLRPTSDTTALIPADNPWSGEPDAEPLVWASGLRNPWRIDVDPVTGDLWVADVGQSEVEEVSVVDAEGAVAGGAGADFGWSTLEGDDPFNDDTAPDPRTLVVAPVHTYTHDDGRCSITGGVVHRGPAVPELWGWYLFADHCSGRLQALDRRRGVVVDLGTVERPTAVERGPGGEVYIATGGGEVLSVGRP